MVALVLLYFYYYCLLLLLLQQQLAHAAAARTPADIGTAVPILRRSNASSPLPGTVRVDQSEAPLDLPSGRVDTEVDSEIRLHERRAKVAAPAARDNRTERGHNRGVVSKHTAKPRRDKVNAGEMQTQCLRINLPS
jgi:hypothetical protein